MIFQFTWATSGSPTTDATQYNGPLSDKEVTQWEIGVHRQEEVKHGMVAEWNSAAITEKDGEAADTLTMELSKERAQLYAECTEDEVQKEAT